MAEPSPAPQSRGQGREMWGPLPSLRLLTSLGLAAALSALTQFIVTRQIWNVLGREFFQL